MKKYELTEETTTYLGKTLHRIKYLIDIRNHNIKAGDLGGWIQQETNLSQDGDCCVKDDAMVMDNGMVVDNGCVVGNAAVMDKGYVADNGYVMDNGRVRDEGIVRNNGYVGDSSTVAGNGKVIGNAMLMGNATVMSDGMLSGNDSVSGNGIIRSGKDVVTISGFFGKRENITFYRTDDDNIGVTCGKHTWNLDEFRKTANQMYKDIDITKECIAIADLVEKRFKRSEDSKGRSLNKLSF